MHLGDGGGPPDHVRPWLAALAENGRLEVVVPNQGRVSRLYEEIAKTTVLPYAPLTFPSDPVRFGLLPVRLARETIALARHFRQAQPDVVVVVTAVVPQALLGARSAGVPVTTYAAEILTRPMAGAALEKLTARLATAIVCCSETLARRYRARGAAYVSTIYPGVDADTLGGDGAAFRRRHGLDHASPCVAVVGNISEGRGQDVALRALALLRLELPAAHCVIAGTTLSRSADLSYRARLDRLVEELGLREAVTFTGFVEAVGDLYAAVDVVVNPVRVQEAFGRAGIEALAAGRPVVASRIGAIPEVLSDGEDAVLVEPGDPAAIAAAVSSLWREESLRTRLVEHGRAHVLNDFSERGGVAAFREVVRSVTRGAGARPGPR